MKKLTCLMIMILSIIALNSCTDTNDLENQIDNVENRVSELENLSKQINTNNDYVTNVIEIRDNDKVIGYTFKFSKSESISVLLGKDGDSFFQSVTQDEDNIYLNLIDGKTITLPKEKQLTITFEESEDISITAGATKTLNYTITGATTLSVVKAMGQNGWSAKVTPTDNGSGTITVTAPDPLIEDEILVWVYDGENKTIMRSINFVTGVIEVASNAYSLPKDASSQTVSVNTNVDYIVEIPEDAQSWLSVLSTRSAMRTEILTFNLTENVELERYATVLLKSNVGKVLQAIAFVQEGSSLVIEVSTPGTLLSLLGNQQKQNITILSIKGTLDNNDFITIMGMTKLEKLDISLITNTSLPEKMFENNQVIQEVVLPNQLVKIPNNMFASSSIKYCRIPDNVISIGSAAFRFCNKLEGNLYLPSTLKEIENGAFSACISLDGDLMIPDNVNIIGYQAFAGCGFDGKLIIGNSVKTIGGYAFEWCKDFIGELIIPSSVRTIGSYAFNYCIGFSGDLILPNGVEIIEDRAFSNCTGLNGELIISNTIKKIAQETFRNCNGLIGDLIIPNGVETIEFGAFYESNGFNGNLIISETVTKISSFAFKLCSGIKTIYCKSQLPPLLVGTEIFPHNKRLNIPSGLKQLYENATPYYEGYDVWSSFLVIEEVDFEELGI